MKMFSSHGKLLLTGEYFVLEGATALAVPTKFEQNLKVELIQSPELIWKSYTAEGDCWLEAVFELPKLRLVNAVYESEEDGGNDMLAEDLNEILQQVCKLNPHFLKSGKGYLVTTVLTFPRKWGLGTSSTLINNLANWAQVNPFELLLNTFGGSGYDIAAAQHNRPILFTKNTQSPVNQVVKLIDFDPVFKDQLFFVYLNQKQNSRQGILRFKENRYKISHEIETISKLTDQIVTCNDLKDFERLLRDHEAVVSSIIGNAPVQKVLFSDYFGQTKSLGAWGGDFILASGNEDTPQYFRQKGFQTVLPYAEMVL